MPILVALRDFSGPAADDLIWPAVTGDLLIRLEPSEVIRWRGAANVGEIRRPQQPGAAWELVWKLTEPADCLITDRRITYRGHDFRKGTGPMATAVAELRRPQTVAVPSVLAGQVRYQWAAAVSLAAASPPNQATWGITLSGQDGDIAVRLVLTMDEKICGAAPEGIAFDVAAGMASDIARFRLAARARTLEPDQIRQLTAQRDNPAPVIAETTRRWPLPGALKLGGRSDIQPRRSPLYAEALAAMQQYEARGKAADLNRAIQFGDELLRDKSAGPHNELMYLNLCAGLLSLKYRLHGDLGDLARCIDIQRQTAERAVSEAPEQAAGCFHNLGGVLIERFLRTLDVADLRDGIAAHEKAVAMTPRDSADWADHQDGLAQAMKARYVLSRDKKELDRAIRNLENVLRSTSDGSPDKPGYLLNLSNTLMVRHEQHGGQGDLKRAVDLGQTAVRLTPQESPDYGTALLSLASSLGKLYERDGDPAHAQAAIDAWREGCRCSRDLGLSRALQGALNWVTAMISDHNWVTAVEACEAGLDAADALYRLQLTRDDQSVWLEEASPLPGQAAYALARLGRLPEAVAVIERGRAVFFAEALSRGQAALDTLAGIGFGELRDSYRVAADKVARFEAAAQHASEGADFAAARQQRDAVRLARAGLDRVIESIRALPGYEDFLTRPSYADAAQAAAGTCLAYVTATWGGGFALLVDGLAGGEPDISVVWLDELSDDHVLDVYRQFRERFLPAFVSGQEKESSAALDAVTRRLWDIALGPVLHAFRGDRLMLIPGGRHLDLLPLHAAWTDDGSAPGGRRYAFDTVCLAYAPSARVLQVASQRAVRPADSFLAVFDPALRHSEEEVQDARRCFNSGEILPNDRVTRRSLQEKLPQYSVLHFSCHGTADLASPLKSRLGAASDEPLTLRDILDRPLGARLCVLSACESAVAGGFVPDQAIGLPGGLLQAGAAGVVGSLWPVGDLAARVLLTRFYQLWQGDGLEPAKALRQAQIWLRDSARQHSHGPRDADWAAFVYVGA